MPDSKVKKKWTVRSTIKLILFILLVAAVVAFIVLQFIGSKKMGGLMQWSQFAGALAIILAGLNMGVWWKDVKRKFHFKSETTKNLLGMVMAVFVILGSAFGGYSMVTGSFARQITAPFIKMDAGQMHGPGGDKNFEGQAPGSSDNSDNSDSSDSSDKQQMQPPAKPDGSDNPDGDNLDNSGSTDSSDSDQAEPPEMPDNADGNAPSDGNMPGDMNGGHGGDMHQKSLPARVLEIVSEIMLFALIAGLIDALISRSRRKKTDEADAKVEEIEPVGAAESDE